jgi:uncharacterized Tic20 family protein
MSNSRQRARWLSNIQSFAEIVLSLALLLALAVGSIIGPLVLIMTATVNSADSHDGGADVDFIGFRLVTLIVTCVIVLLVTVSFAIEPAMFAHATNIALRVFAVLSLLLLVAAIIGLTNTDEQFAGTILTIAAVVSGVGWITLACMLLFDRKFTSPSSSR